MNELVEDMQRLLPEGSVKTTEFAAKELVMKFGKRAARMTARTRVAVWTKRNNAKQVAYWTEVLKRLGE
jgi:hypothetical protein